MPLLKNMPKLVAEGYERKTHEQPDAPEDFDQRVEPLTDDDIPF
jgi:hypothetical protein